jgi:PAS domain S-box-containing protein
VDPQLIQQLSTSELDMYASELDLALETHSRWLLRVNRALIFRSGFNPEDVTSYPHLICRFGNWYHGLADSVLLDVPEFAAIGAVHAKVHGLARNLLLVTREGKAISREDYDGFARETEGLRHLIESVRSGIRQNLGMISKLMGRVFESATEGVVITTPEGTILTVNKAFTDVTGYTTTEAIGQTPNILNSGRQGKEFYAAMWAQLSRSGQWQGEIWNRRKNGDVYLEWLSVTGVRNDRDQLTHYVAIFSDITTEKENEERLYQLAHYDPLTELPNRVLFQDRFRQALARDPDFAQAAASLGSRR